MINVLGGLAAARFCSLILPVKITGGLAGDHLKGPVKAADALESAGFRDLRHGQIAVLEQFNGGIHPVEIHIP